MSTVRIGKGGTQATWDMIYGSRRKILYAGPEEDTAPMWAKIRGASSTNSDTILQTLIEKGRLPGHALHNANSVAPFRELDARDNGNDIKLSLTLTKGGDIQKVLKILGGRLQGYVDGHPAGEVSRDELQHLLDCAHMEAMAANREEDGHTPNLKRAFGLWLWDWKHSHPAAKDMRQGYEELSAFCDKHYDRENSSHLPIKNGTFFGSKRELQKYITLTEACIKAGKSLPLSS